MEGELGDGGGVPPDVAQELNEEGHEGQEVAEQEAEQEAPDYATPELVRPLANWEISGTTSYSLICAGLTQASAIFCTYWSRDLRESTAVFCSPQQGTPSSYSL